MLQPSETGEQILSEVKLEPGWLVQEMKSASAEARIAALGRNGSGRIAYDA
jgi:hypothetical protein